MTALQTYLVEDSNVIRENLIATLEELSPVRVIGSAGTEAEAVHWLVEPGSHADLVIVDLFLAAGSGFGVLRAARSLPQHDRLVVLSNYATVDVRRRCLALGAHRVFDKSRDIDALLSYCHALAAGTAGPAAAH